MPVKIVEVGDDAVPVEGQFEGIAIFGTIPGAIYGRPEPPYAQMKADTITGFAFNLDQLNAIRGQAAPLTPSAVASGMVVAPANTRLVRVATNFRISDASDLRAFVGFADSDPKQALILVYFDQPCRVTGTLIVPPRFGQATKNRFDVTIDKAGFQWLSMSSKDASDLSVIRQASESVRPIFVVKLAPMPGKSQVPAQTPYNLGVAAYKKRNYSEAAAQWTKEVDSGNTGAMNNLAYLLYNGYGVGRDTNRAVQLWRVASDAGESESQWHLGKAYETGVGVERSLPKAYAWYLCAIQTASNNSKAANKDYDTEAAILRDARESLDKMKDRLSASELEAGRALAVEYIERYGNPSP